MEMLDSVEGVCTRPHPSSPVWVLGSCCPEDVYVLGGLVESVGDLGWGSVGEPGDEMSNDRAYYGGGHRRAALGPCSFPAPPEHSEASAVSG